MSVDYTKICAWDMEMACWDDQHRRKGEIISIGVAEFCLITGDFHREAHYLVKPDRDEISEYCSNLTGITQRMINRQGRPLNSVLDSMHKKFGSSGKIYAAWGEDSEYLHRECRWKRIPFRMQKSIDASLIYHLKKRLVTGQSIGLSKAMAESSMAFEGDAHNALTDAKNLARLIYQEKLL